MGRWRKASTLEKRHDELQERKAEPVLPSLCPYLPVFCLCLKQTSAEQEAAPNFDKGVQMTKTLS